jgi:hypothetical protein
MSTEGARQRLRAINCTKHPDGNNTSTTGSRQGYPVADTPLHPELSEPGLHRQCADRTPPPIPTARAPATTDISYSVPTSDLLSVLLEAEAVSPI